MIEIIDSIYFHEDSYGQIELVPIENERFVDEEIRKITNFSEEHKAEDGFGWTDVYVRNDPKKNIFDYKIKKIDFEELFEATGGHIEKVYTGYSSYREECKNTNAYKLDEIALFYSYKDDYISDIWFDFYLEDEGAAKNLYLILKVIANAYDVLFVHWGWGYYSRIKQDKTLKDKLISFSKE